MEAESEGRNTLMPWGEAKIGAGSVELREEKEEEEEEATDRRGAETSGVMVIGTVRLVGVGRLLSVPVSKTVKGMRNEHESLE